MLQAEDEPPTFPQERALVTNTCSKRNDGFSYGFLFVAGVRGVCSEDSGEKLFIAIREKPVYFSVDWETCIAQPPVPDVPQTSLPRVKKYT